MRVAPALLELGELFEGGFETFDDFLGKNGRMIFLTLQTSTDLNGLSSGFLVPDESIVYRSSLGAKNSQSPSAPIRQHDSVANGKKNVFDPPVFLNPIIQGCNRPRVCSPVLKTLPARSMLSKTNKHALPYQIDRAIIMSIKQIKGEGIKDEQERRDRESRKKPWSWS